MQYKQQLKILCIAETESSLHWLMEVVAKLEMQTSHDSTVET